MAATIFALPWTEGSIGIGEVTIIAAKDAKIDAINVAGESFAGDSIIKCGEGGGGETAGDRFGEVGFVDGTDGKRQPAL